LLLQLLSVLAESEAITDVARFGEKKPLRVAFRELGIRLLDAAPGRCTIPTRTVRYWEHMTVWRRRLLLRGLLFMHQPVDEFAEAAGLRTKPSLTHRNQRPDPGLK